MSFNVKDHRDKKAQKLDSESTDEFKQLCDRLLLCTPVAGYQAAKTDMDLFIAADDSRAFLTSSVSWWRERRGFIFRAFTSPNAPQMNQAEVVHVGWAHRDRQNLSLLDACQADTRDALLLDVEIKAYSTGRVVTRYTGSGISGFLGVGSGITTPESGFTTRRIGNLHSQPVGSGSAVFLLNQGSKFTTFWGSKIKILNVFEIRDQNFGQK